ncbi:hypothetical protein CBE37_01575 [bacterium TMED277]|nr:hypothetical protein [Candidatus Pelagibacter sp.]OUX44235.1 MAG: hypothetical protein CBE37_01575 [bacterium TMED277]|tara:strand:- start:43 stop:837 length:795 start_codon:yes stop_codon:yes gene_type:complete
MKKTPKKIIALISVRSNSKRLFNKSLRKYKGKNAIDRIIENIKASKYINKIIVATSKNNSDTKIVDHCKKIRISCFRGDEINLIERFYQSGKKYNPKIIVRITGDNPFISFEIADFMIKNHLKKKADFTYMDRTNLPAGICPEIINFNCLEKILKSNINFKYSEYMTYYFINNPKFFNLNKIKPLKSFRFNDFKLRFSLDYKKDLIFLKKIIDLLKNPKGPIKLSRLYQVARKNPEIAKINKNLKTKWKSKKLIHQINKASIIV